jgi:anti-sigma factor RsiW
MKPVDPAELSALLDGELSPERSREVEAAIASDPELRTEWEQLRILDARWRSAAATAAFRPQIFAEQACRETGQTTPGGRLSPALDIWFLAVLAGLVIPRFLPKLTDLPLLSIFLHAAALVVVAMYVGRASATLDCQEGPAAPVTE